MKGIILAADSGKMFEPLIGVTSKYLLPVYNKPMIYYPLSTIMEAGINEVLIIASPQDIVNLEYLLGAGDTLGIKISYKSQASSNGIANAFILGEDFIGDDSVILLLGDSIFIDPDIKRHAFEAINRVELQKQATIFSCLMQDPYRFDVLKIDNSGRILSIEEKSKKPVSDYCVTGVYFYPNDVIQYAKQLKSSTNKVALEIADINNKYIDSNRLHVEIMNHDFIWMSVSNIELLYEATMLVKTIEDHQHIPIGCVEVVAYSNGWISPNELFSFEIGDTKRGVLKAYKNDHLPSNNYVEFIYSCVTKDLLY